ncbi:glycosyltransferase [Halarcobacter mediterraneus]|uniref:Glycosyltransferase n=1 Tax=Halarcobacter mediterraneus TaxID=2023153 RepID=A0A4Q1ARS3_9BACT|nr:glycosyltransferase family 4 protein [Halarcobacter mediterraneus]RXK12284.1 glycosyltransferase [Halarcobacter mediterraneus]
MKIAIVAPSPIPFGIGGAEKLWWGMINYINTKTNHQCELIKIPIKENNFWNLIDAYYKFYCLDVSHFDMVITTKYPAWMLQHNNHHIYLQHCLRGLYDTYSLMSLPEEFISKHQKVNHLLHLLNTPSTTSINQFFNALFDLKKDPTISQNTYDFPGPLIRKIIHFLDKKAMENIKAFSAISQTVINRKEYFPKNTLVQKVYHPSNLEGLHNNTYEYFFTASRLDDAKRIEMIVKAYLKSKTKIPLKVAGTGPLEAQLRKLAKNDSRIEFLGFISDEELIKYYSNAYAVLFVPYDEDYGLITIEAAMCHKPVLTFSDTGGVVEFIKDNETGLVCEPKVSELTKKIDFISENPQFCKQMGEKVYNSVVDITWENTITSLLNPSIENTKKDKITVVTTYSIYPPRGGGQNRIFYLYKEISKFIKVEIICLVGRNQNYRKVEISPDFFEIRVPKSRIHEKKEIEIEKKAGIPITDIAMLYLYNETPKLQEEIKKSAATSKYIITSHPYTYSLIKEIVNIPIIHESHNVEYNLKKQMLEDNPYNKKLLEKLFEVEKEACQDSIYTTVCSKDDAYVMEELYNLDINKSLVVPNGVDLNTVPYISSEKRQELQSSFKAENEKIVLFIGSWHQPNIEAVEEIFLLANTLPEYNFIILGSVEGYFSSHKKPKNVGFTGIVTDEEKEIYLSIADIAINPMLSGSGTNLKMLDYMANGIPVISTKIGARGLDIPAEYIVNCDIKEFKNYILNIKDYVNIEKSRKYVEENFSWEVIQKQLEKILK